MQRKLKTNDNNNRTAVPTANMEQNTGNESLAKEKAKGFDSLVNISVTSYRKRKHDPDGISIKAVLDGIIRRGILINDSTSEINEVTLKSVIIKKDEEERTIITLSDDI